MLDNSRNYYSGLFKIDCEKKLKIDNITGTKTYDQFSPNKFLLNVKR